MKELVYKILDALTGHKGLRKTINGFSIKLPTRYINYFPAEYEKENFEFLVQQVKKGEAVLDIGAHIGLFSVIAAQLSGSTGKVYAFEPASETFKLLQKTIDINKMTQRIEPQQAAVGALSGKATFYVSAVEGDNSNSLVSYKGDRELYATEVDVFSIDDFVRTKNIRQLSFIKIDVEGGEYDALMGAGETLKNLRPSIILAIHPEPIAAKGDSLEKIYDLLVANNYRILHGKDPISREKFCSNRELIDLHLLPA